MLSIALGPLALPLQPLLLLLAVWGASALASRWATSRGSDGAAAGHHVFIAALVGLLAARAVHLALNVGPYLDQAWAALDLRDGGWHLPAGVAAGTAWLAWRGWGAPALRRPLAVGALAGTVFWAAASALAGAGAAATMPTLLLAEFNSGRTATLQAAARGRPVVVNLWASWCGPCRQEMPTLAAAQQAEAGVGFLFVNQGETQAAVRAYLATLGLPLREVWLDSGARLGPAVGSQGLPTTLFYDADGRLVHAHFGVLNGPALQSRLRTLRASL